MAFFNIFAYLSDDRRFKIFPLPLIDIGPLPFVAGVVTSMGKNISACSVGWANSKTLLSFVRTYCSAD